MTTSPKPWSFKINSRMDAVPEMIDRSGKVIAQFRDFRDAELVLSLVNQEVKDEDAEVYEDGYDKGHAAGIDVGYQQAIAELLEILQEKIKKEEPSAGS